MLDRWNNRRAEFKVVDIQEGNFGKFLESIEIFLDPDMLGAKNELELQRKLMQFFKDTRNNKETGEAGKNFSERSMEAIGLFFNWLVLEKKVDKEIVESTCKAIWMKFNEYKRSLDRKSEKFENVSSEAENGRENVIKFPELNKKDSD